MPIPYYPFTGWLSTHTYFMASVMTVVAIVAAYYIGYYEAKRKGLDLNMFFMSALWMGAGAVLGGRIAFFLTPGPGFLNIYHGGGHSWGVILGGFLGLLIYLIYKFGKEYKKIYLYIGRLLDIWVLGVAIGTFFYRIGDFLSHCIEVGTPTNLPWAVIDNSVARHPINIYYSITGLIIFIVLLEIQKQKIARRQVSYIAEWFIILYSFSRVILDFMREYTFLYLGINTAQWVFLIFILIGFFNIYLDRFFTFNFN